MPSSPEDRLRVAAVISALKTAGVRVKNWKNFLNGEATLGDAYKQERRCNIFAFGRDLALLPQCHLPEMGGAVPRFLVDTCEFLSQHLHTEGLFRKTGSLSRIRALRVGLEQGEPAFSPPLSSSLQPCDVASLLKQFLRELPSPLIPLELQGALCRAQGLGPEGGSREGGPGGATLLVTALFPPSHARALRYLCTFLKSAAQRSSENRMEVGSLALLMAPNLLQGLAPGCKLTVATERLLDRQTAVITALITHAERIGVIPSVIMEALSGAAPLGDGAGFQEKAGLSVYRSMKRQRRRSVGEMFVDAFSKLKSGRAPNGPSQPSDTAPGQQGAAVTIPQSPSTTKRKASEEMLPEVEGSARKRRSIHDLREDNQPPSLSCSDDSESPLSQSPTPSLCSVTSALECSDEHRLLGPLTPSAKKRNHRRNTRRVQRVPGPDDRAQRRRRSLRFFTANSWSSTGTAPSDGAGADNWLLGTQRLTDNPGEPPSCKGGGPFHMPVILIDGPGGVVVGSEVEDDPETFNCSFVESPGDPPVTSRRVWSAAQLVGAGDGRAHGGGATAEVEEETDGQEVGVQPELAESEGSVGAEDWRQPVVDVFRRVSWGYRPPRRSISLPEVSSEQVGGQGEGAEEEEEEEDVKDEFRGSDFPSCAWSVEVSVKDRNGQAWNDTGSEPSDGGRGGEEVQQDKCKVTEREKKGKKDEKRRAAREGGGKVEESWLGFVRSQQRLSVADRMRRFNVLSAWLRAPPRPPPTPLTPQRGPVRLRRQGARRFSRSVSHEAVAGLLLEPGTAKLPPQSQELLKNTGQDPSPNPVNHLNPLNLLNSHNPQDPLDSTPLSSSDSQNPLNPPNPLKSTNTLSPSNLHNPLNLLNPSNPQNPLSSFLEPIRPPDISSKPPKPPRHRPSRRLPPNPGGQRYPHGQHWIEPQQDPGRPPDKHEPHTKQEPQEGEKGPLEPDLHKLLELQLRIQRLQPEPPLEPPVSQSSLCSALPSKNGRSPCLLSLPSPPPHLTDARSHRAPAISPPAQSLPASDLWHPLEVDGCIDWAPELAVRNDRSSGRCADGLNGTVAREADPRPSLSPPALRFRAPANRRRYRDSPRWPIPEIHITTLTPYQL